MSLTLTAVPSSSVSSAAVSSSAAPSFDGAELAAAIATRHHLADDQYVHLLVDLDGLSHLGPQDDARCSDHDLVAELARLVDVAATVGRTRFRAGCSSRTAFVHWQALTVLPNNSWQIRRGVDGADALLIDELDHLASRPTTGAVLLFGGDHAYAAATERAVSAGIPVWVVAREGSLSRALREAATGHRLMPG